jgi:glycosyltransferase involved in cell wall biosynthesis
MGNQQPQTHLSPGDTQKNENPALLLQEGGRDPSAARADSLRAPARSAQDDSATDSAISVGRAIVEQPAPRVSVIIPAYNTAPLIGACLDSVFAQTFQDFEAIVVNDGSPDTPDLEKALEPYMNRIVYIQQANKRAAGARNTGIAHARGEFLAFLDSDDEWLPNHLESQMKQFNADPSLALAYANSVLVGDPKRQTEFMTRCPSEGPANFQTIVVERCQIPVATVVARKAAILKAGGFDETLARCDDYDMWLRTAFYGGKVGYNRQVQARMAIGRPGALGQSRTKNVEAYWIILDKLKRTLPLQGADRAVLENRETEIRARCRLEQGKRKLEEHQFDEARRLLVEANSYLRRSSLSLAVLGLSIAPIATTKLMSFFSRIRHGAA